MSASIKTFFDQFAHDFATFDGELIAARYTTPYVAVSSEGTVECHMTHADIAGHFQSLLNDYKRRGVVACRYRDLTTTTIGECCLLSSLTWELLAPDDQVVLQWRESYNLVERASGLRIYASADFAGL